MSSPTSSGPRTFEKDRPVVFRNGTVLTMDRQRTVLSGADVLVVGERIEAVGPTWTPEGRWRSTPPMAS